MINCMTYDSHDHDEQFPDHDCQIYMIVVMKFVTLVVYNDVVIATFHQMQLYHITWTVLSCTRSLSRAPSSRAGSRAIMRLSST